MIITCPRCFATYTVPDMALSGRARQVRCSSCRFEWTESPPPVEAIAALAPQTIAEIVAPTSYVAPEPAQVAAKSGKATAKAPPRRRGGAAPSSFSFRQLGVQLAWGVLAALVLLSTLVLMRERIGHMSPMLADMYEDVGLPVEGPNDWFRFEHVKLEKSEMDGKLVFSIHGQVINQSRRERALPPLRLFWLTSKQIGGPEQIVKADVARLGPGQSAGFSGQLVGVDASSGGEIKINFYEPHEETADHAPVEYAADAPASHAPAPATDSHAAPHAAAPKPAPAGHDEAPASHDAPAHESASQQHESPVGHAPVEHAEDPHETSPQHH